ncbi:MAG TPA: hypothetical protein VIR03_00420 [Candidatus Saccharimonadales bacterium]
MPSYPVEVPRDPDTFVLPQARQFGALVCPQVVVLKTKEGVVQAIHNPVVENPNDALPLIFVGADGHGARFDRIRAGDFAAITFLDSDGSKDDNNRPHDCDRTTVRVIQAVDARNPANKSYVLVGQDSSLQDGDRVVPSEQAAGTYDLISYAVDLVPTDPRQAYLRPAGQ